jgi:hypothetical protein
LSNGIASSADDAPVIAAFLERSLRDFSGGRYVRVTAVDTERFHRRAWPASSAVFRRRLWRGQSSLAGTQAAPAIAAPGGDVEQYSRLFLRGITDLQHRRGVATLPRRGGG